MARVNGLLCLLAALCLGGTATAQEKPHWVASWATAQMVPTGENVAPAEDLTDATIRQIVRVSIGGKRLRVRLSNAFGTAPLIIDAASVALSADNATPRIVPASARGLRFGGQPKVTIPAGADYLSDPVDLAIAPGADLAITLHLPLPPDRQTGHPGARAHSHFAPGQQVMAAALAGAKTSTRRYVIGGVEVDAPGAGALVILGDSITDGYGVQPDTNARWPDRLALRLHANPATRSLAVLNAGIGGNRLRLDGTGPNALARFERDVLTPPGVTHLLVIEGINDLARSPATRRPPPSSMRLWSAR